MDFITAFSFIIFMALTPFAAMGVYWLGVRAGELIQARVDNEALRCVLLRLNDAVVTAVKDLEQSVVDEVKAAAEDGRISRGERRRIKEKAVRHVKSYLGPKGLKELGGVLGLWDLAVEDFIGSKVEAAVLDLRRTAAGNPSGAPSTATASSTDS